MYARVTFATTQPGKTDEITKVVRDSILPAAKKQKGFKGLLSLTDRGTGKGIVIVMWDSEANMTAGETSGFYREQVAKAVPFLAETPTMEHYEVGVHG